MDPMSLARFTESLKLKPGEMNAPQLIIGGGDGSPASLIGKDKKDVGGKHNVDFVRKYSCEEMGKKLESLRPEKKGKWFSLQELNDRLAKMRLLEEKEIKARGSAFPFEDLRESLMTINLKSEEQAKRNSKFFIIFLSGISCKKSKVC